MNSSNRDSELYSDSHATSSRHQHANVPFYHSPPSSRGSIGRVAIEPVAARLATLRPNRSPILFQLMAVCAIAVACLVAFSMGDRVNSVVRVASRIVAEVSGGRAKRMQLLTNDSPVGGGRGRATRNEWRAPGTDDPGARCARPQPHLDGSQSNSDPPGIGVPQEPTTAPVALHSSPRDVAPPIEQRVTAPTSDISVNKEPPSSGTLAPISDGDLETTQTMATDQPHTKLTAAVEAYRTSMDVLRQQKKANRATSQCFYMAAAELCEIGLTSGEHDKRTVREILRHIHEDEQLFDLVSSAANGWIDWSKRECSGILVAGDVESVERHRFGRLVRVRTEDRKSSLIPILVADKTAVWKLGQRALLMGLIVNSYDFYDQATDAPIVQGTIITQSGGAFQTKLTATHPNGK